ncbi:MAG: 2-hydroxyglutaryl-CoA dehydratase [Deltaproteobacteria bacterium]|nr:2-hydroxyglutaryl-CoA dehydratase [Deltaproteobacteria bacterium]
MTVQDVDLKSLEAELAAFETLSRQELGLEDKPKDHWFDAVPSTFTRDQRAHTTILVSGLTMAQDLFVQSALRGVGYKVEHMDCPDNDALRYGKEFGNRGQCNPTYFTVGNLVKHLDTLRKKGMRTEDVVENYVFLTAGACGPCRFGTYVTEYRKALRDSGFDGFRVMLFQQKGGLKQATGQELGLELAPPFFIGIVKALLAGDVLNAVGYRMRPYEVESGATDRALDACKAIIVKALEQKTNIMVALLKCRFVLSKVELDRSISKPKVAIIGEFWAMTTEGDGNYKLQRFLEQEGAEVDVQLVTAWLLYNVWEGKYDTEERMTLRKDDKARKGLAGVNVAKKRAILAVADVAIRVLFQSFANTIGLHGYHLPNMKQVGEVSHKHYDNNLRGGEGHMEVGKLILNVIHSKVNMTLSVKPFGCMPSSGVSDGVQSWVTERYPDGIFLPIETTGDGAVNVQSRVQMMLFKAKQLALKERDETLAAYDLSVAELRKFGKRFSPLFKSPHVHGSSAADWAELYGSLRHPMRALKRRREKAKIAAARLCEALAPKAAKVADAVTAPSRKALDVLS